MSNPELGPKGPRESIENEPRISLRLTNQQLDALTVAVHNEIDNAARVLSRLDAKPEFDEDRDTIERGIANLAVIADEIVRLRITGTDHD